MNPYIAEEVDCVLSEQQACRRTGFKMFKPFKPFKTF